MKFNEKKQIQIQYWK